ncbi:bifunctional 2',3'-cyclic-nucleotide 2'-phosphodiesterase/3'-nucleotidase [Oceanicella actignis]|uniref:2',3'-cyclic-nucleotide 2'-phosphodiesterase / 3'-nucleotidase n=1 Tax=Oceanicella actignis TaxID=1189325 RepID=A0A1M7T488_9RHOB|nr:bifunctional 2',3'-cyclic-nucleotide 2'-phosphodiesterase/3'-nucleotidase [Oceanicella actignis]SET41057.1 2',3'-cyclic-nucleotide 2'-phosphodiesterase / 3'-nucleotidase [Oceanicella actignis]SHN65474.1 2',3'-cyclic-nucleotide 2'-phosphodiesterase / 3'-nucleotidase [Oceanicella actignis]
MTNGREAGGEAAFARRLGPGRAHLRILGTTDLHAHLAPYDYFADRPAPHLGLSRAAALIRSLRAQAPNALLFDNGDFLQGNPLADLAAREQARDPGATHPVIAAMNALGYDAATLGNHEFDYGLDTLAAALRQARFPVVLANLARRRGADPTRDEGFVPPYVILERTLRDGAGAAAPIRIGVIGFCPPQTLQWDHGRLAGLVEARGIAQSARALVPLMKAHGADLVVALCHAGIVPIAARPDEEEGAQDLALIEGVDVILAGHQHLTFPGAHPAAPGVDPARGTVHGKPAAMAGFGGAHVAAIDLLLGRGRGGWRVMAHEVRLARTAALPAEAADPAVQAAADAAHARALALIRQPVGRLRAPISTFFAMAADDPSLRLVNRAQSWRVAQALRGTPLARLPLVSAAAPFRCGGRGGPDNYACAPAGAITMRHVAELHPYPNELRALLIDGATLKEWLERAAAAFNRILPGREDQPLLAPDFPSFNFDVVDGVTYRIDLTAPARYDLSGRLIDPGAERIVDLRLGGRPLDPCARLVLATNSYRAGGGGAFPGVRPEAIVFETAETNRDALLAYLRAHPDIAPPRAPGWSFAPAPGASALFPSSPRAVAHLDQPHAAGIAPVGPGPGGFMLYRLRLDPGARE